jgi:hypothetical protein
LLSRSQPWNLLSSSARSPGDFPLLTRCWYCCKRKRWSTLPERASVSLESIHGLIITSNSNDINPAASLWMATYLIQFLTLRDLTMGDKFASQTLGSIHCSLTDMRAVEHLMRLQATSSKTFRKESKCLLHYNLT